jgi:hypothetical protein
MCPKPGPAAAPAGGPAAEVPFGNVDAYTEDMDGASWWKGDVHMHTMLSDGSVFPVEAAALYKRLGFNFIVLTDHDMTPSSRESYIGASSHHYASLTPEYFERLRRNFPEFVPAVRLDRNGKKEYRVMPFGELCEAVEEAGKYLVIPGNELTYLAKDGNNLHCNLINIDRPCRSTPGRADAADALEDALARAREVGCVNSPRNLLMLNHPLWTCYDVDPGLLVNHPEIRFFEVNISGSMATFELPPGDCFTHDKWWDAVNATRATLGQPLLYGTASDDQHNYASQYAGKLQRPGYVRVAAKTLTAESIVTAMHKGNFYATSGLELSQVRFDPDSNTLKVSVKSEPGRRYRIMFIGSKRGAELNERGRVRWRVSATPAHLRCRFNPERSVPYYSPAIGVTLKTCDSASASYTMRDDDLYVRAKIITDLGVLPENQTQMNPVAWTQPVLNRKYRAG